MGADTASLVFLNYFNVIAPHALSGLVAKTCLIAAMAILWLGSMRQGQQLLSAVLAIQCLPAFMLLWNEDGALRPAAVVALLIACCVGYNAFQPEGRWRLLPNGGWQKPAVLLLYAWAWILPTFVSPLNAGGVLKAILFSPTGVLPHAVLYVMLGLVVASGEDTPRLPGWAAVVGAVVLGVFDVFWGKMWGSSMLLVGAGVAGYTLYRNVAVVGVFEDDEPVSTKIEREKSKRRWKRDEGDGQPGRKYRIK